MILQSRLRNVKAINIQTACCYSEATVVRAMINFVVGFSGLSRYRDYIEKLPYSQRHVDGT